MCGSWSMVSLGWNFTKNSLCLGDFMGMIEARRQWRIARLEWLADENERVQVVPDNSELAEARRRFPLVPQMSDAELLRFHRDHPRGWCEGEGEA